MRQTRTKKYWSWDTDDKLIIIFVSSKVKQYLGYDTQDMILKEIYNFITKDAIAKFKEEIDNLVNNRNIFVEFELEFITKLNDTKPFHVNMLRKFDDDNKIVGYCGTCFENTK